jgi:hypothetical protein
LVAGGGGGIGGGNGIAKKINRIIIRNNRKVPVPLLGLIILALVCIGDDGGVDGVGCCRGGRGSEYSFGSNRPHFVLCGLSFTSVNSITFGVIL